MTAVRQAVARPTTLSRLAIGVRVTAGMALLAQLTTRWFERGPGSSFTGASLANRLLHGQLVPLGGRWFGAAIWYAALFGALCLATAPSRTRSWWQLVRVAAMLPVVALVVATAAAVPIARWHVGPWLVASAVVLVVAAEFVSWRAR